MTRQDKIEVLQDWVSKNYITHAENLKGACRHEKETSGEDIDWYDDILAPMEWNCCDRCGWLDDSMNLYWIGYDDYPREELERGMAKEKADYCAICEECVKELMKKGGYIPVEGESRVEQVAVALH